MTAVRSLRYRGGNTFTGVPGPPATPPLGGLSRSLSRSPRLHPAGQPPRLENPYVNQAECDVGAEPDSHLRNEQFAP